MFNIQCVSQIKICCKGTANNKNNLLHFGANFKKLVLQNLKKKLFRQKHPPRNPPPK